MKINKLQSSSNQNRPSLTKNKNLKILVYIAIPSICFTLGVFLGFYSCRLKAMKGVGMPKIQIEKKTTPEEPEDLSSKATPPVLPALTEENLVGIWHDMPMLAAGWSNRYHFYLTKYPAGNPRKYRFYTSEMDCASRKREETGSWELNDGKLKLEVGSETFLRGGRYVQSGGSCGTEKTLIEPSSKETIFLKTPKVLEYEIVINEEPEEHDIYPSIKINNVTYWRFTEDPTGYYSSDKFPEP